MNHRPLTLRLGHGWLTSRQQRVCRCGPSYDDAARGTQQLGGRSAMRALRTRRGRGVGAVSQSPVVVLGLVFCHQRDWRQGRGREPGRVVVLGLGVLSSARVGFRVTGGSLAVVHSAVLCAARMLCPFPERSAEPRTTRSPRLQHPCRPGLAVHYRAFHCIPRHYARSAASHSCSHPSPASPFVLEESAHSAVAGALHRAAAWPTAEGPSVAQVRVSTYRSAGILAWSCVAVRSLRLPLRLATSHRSVASRTQATHLSWHATPGGITESSIVHICSVCWHLAIPSARLLATFPRATPRRQERDCWVPDTIRRRPHVNSTEFNGPSLTLHEA